MSDFLIGLDRDGLIIKDEGKYPGKDWPNETFELMPGVPKGLEILRKIKNAKLVMITNQSGPARGLVKEEHLAEINKAISSMLPFPLDGVYVCTHVKEDYAHKHNLKEQLSEELYQKYVQNCNCRKPKTGMLEAAARELFGKELSKVGAVFMIGDRSSDVKCGLNVGPNGKGVFVPSDVQEHSSLEEAQTLQKQHPGQVIVAKTFIDAAQAIQKELSDQA